MNVPPPRNCAPSDTSEKSPVSALSGILTGIEEIITVLRVGDSECVGGSLNHAACWTVCSCAPYGGIASGHRESDRGGVVVVRPTTESDVKYMGDRSCR